MPNVGVFLFCPFQFYHWIIMYIWVKSAPKHCIRLQLYKSFPQVETFIKFSQFPNSAFVINRLSMNQSKFTNLFCYLRFSACVVENPTVISGGSRIFPRGGREPSRGGVNTPNFPENCMKSKEFGRPGGGVRPSRPPLDPPMVMLWRDLDQNSRQTLYYTMPQSHGQPSFF